MISLGKFDIRSSNTWSNTWKQLNVTCVSDLSVSILRKTFIVEYKHGFRVERLLLTITTTGFPSSKVRKLVKHFSKVLNIHSRGCTNCIGSNHSNVP